MKKPTKSLSEAELEIMSVIWTSKEAVTSTEIKEQLQGKRSWALSTFMTSLSRLEKKGLVFCDRTTGTNLYGATLTEEEYKGSESRSFLKKLFNGSMPLMVSNMYSTNEMTDKDLQELKEVIRQLESQDRDA